MLEKQSEELVNLREKISEYERREQSCDKKWHELIRDNELCQQEIAAYKEQLVRQRQAYSSMLLATEQKVVNANASISNGLTSNR